MHFRFARKKDKDQIVNIYRFSFDDTEKGVKYFFDNKFNENDCLVCLKGSRVVSAINMFDARIVTSNGLENAKYIYGAATHPLYRNKGFMKNLIDFSNKLIMENDYRYSILLPANDGLYKYYEKLGYISYFKVKVIDLTVDNMLEYISESVYTNDSNELSFNQLNDLRCEILKNNLGSVIWKGKNLEYAININSIYGGNTIITDYGYAICYVDQENILQVTEFISTNEGAKNLINMIYKNYPSVKTYRFRLPAFYDFFKKNCEIRNFGMIKELGVKSSFINICDCPYLGLTLD